MRLNAKYQKYRSDARVRSNAKKLWEFAYTAITETQIRPKREQFKWKNIQLITQTRRDYVDLLVKKKVNNGKLSGPDQESQKVAVFCANF